jgi:hypothetical protein
MPGDCLAVARRGPSGPSSWAKVYERLSGSYVSSILGAGSPDESAGQVPSQSVSRSGCDPSSSGNSAAAIAGPALAGVLATWLTVPPLLYFDAASFLISAGSLVLIGRSFTDLGREN